MDYSELETSTLSPEKLAIMKLRSSYDDRDVFSEPDTTTVGEGLFSSGQSRSKSSRALTTRASRQISSSRRQSSFMQSHRSKMSMELTTHAEAKVFALIDLMASASREANSLKEYWTKLMSDRESFERERDELVMRIDELTETIERTENSHQGRHRELADRKKEVDRLLLELSAAIGSVAEFKRKLGERDHELETSRRENSDVQIINVRLQTDYDKIKVELDSLLPKFRTIESERDRVKIDAELFRNQVRDLTRENADLKARNGDFSIRLDSSTKEVASYIERIRVFERERAGDLFERERLEELLRKANSKAEDANRELLELTERSSTWHRESKRLRDAIAVIEAERDENTTILEKIRLDLKTKSASLDDAESRYGDMHLKYEQLKRDIAVKEDRFGSFEVEIADLRRTIESKQEELRRALFESDQFRDDLENERRKYTDRNSEFTELQGSFSRLEATLTEVRASAFQSTERIRHLERERDEAFGKSDGLSKEILELKEKLNVFQLEIRTLTDARDRARKEAHEHRRRFEEVTQTITEWKDDSGELEFEIESLRTMLYEAREQKERAIAARNVADRERDEALEKYYEKVREMEKMADSRSSFYSSHGHSHGHHGKSESRTTSTRFVTTKSSGGVNGESETITAE